jgi:tetratricopeptide (TPR) repeat protein
MLSRMKLKNIIASTIVLLTLFISNNELFAQSHIEQKFRLAETYEKGGDLEAATELYKEVYAASQQIKYFEALARVLKEQNRFQELQVIVEERLKQNKNIELLLLSGELNWRLGKTDVANTIWTDVLKANSEDINVYIKLSQLLNSLQLFDKSIAILKEAKSKFPQNLSFSDNLSRLYIITGNYSDGISEVFYIFKHDKNLQAAQGKIFALMNTPESIDFIDKAFKKELKSSDETEFLSLYGWYLRANKRFDAALDVFIELDKKMTNDGYQIYNFAQASQRDGEYDIAIKAFQKVISMENSRYANSALFAYAKTLEEKLRHSSQLTQEEAKKIISSYRDIIKKYPKNQYAEESKLRIAYLEHHVFKNYKTAISELENVVQTNLSSKYVAQALSQLSEIYLETNDLDKTREMTEQIIQRFSKQTVNPEISLEVSKAFFLQGKIHYYLGQMDSALVIFQKLSFQTDNDLANNALERIVLIEQNKDFIAPLANFAKAELAMKQSKINDARNLYADVAKSMQGEQLGEQATIELAKLEISENNLEQAKSVLTTYLAEMIYPLYGDNALFLLGNIAEKENMKQQAIERYTEILVKYPRSLFLSGARERIQVLRKEI